jgi:hypothetical protein
MVGEAVGVRVGRGVGRTDGIGVVADGGVVTGRGTGVRIAAGREVARGTDGRGVATVRGRVGSNRCSGAGAGAGTSGAAPALDSPTSRIGW